MGKIHELPKSSSRLLTSAQIISSVYCVAKELIENALDSASTNVEVKLEDYGLEKIEVKDNGCGIDKNDVQLVARPHFTSKISSYSDLDKVETYGFRGEALGAICNVADLVITTKSSEESIGSVVNFGHDGQITSTKPCPCAQGTTVSVLNLFKNLPVRKQYYRSDKNKKEELRKVEDLLVSYGCIQNDVRFALYHNKNLIWQKPALSSTKNALTHILGNSIVDHMKYAEQTDVQNQRKMEIYLPKLDAPLTCGLTTSSRCITAINKRPVRIKAIDKLLKDNYNKAIQNCGKARYPICFVSFTLHLTEVDVNVEPNKTSVLLHHSEEILEQFSEMLKNFYSPDIVMANDNNLPLDESLSLLQDPKTNATEFLNSLKATCDSKLQQSKLTFINGSSASLENSSIKNNLNSLKDHSLDHSDNSLTEKDITQVHSLKEPCKKKLKMSAHSSKKDIDNHINTLKDFFTAKEQTNVSKVPDISNDFMNSMPTVTVQRVCSNSNGVNSDSNKDVNGIGEGTISTFAVSSNCSTHFNSDYSNNRKRHLSDSSVPTFKLNEDSMKSPIISTNGQNREAWSRGVLPSGELIQPVAVLQPKPASTLNPSLKDPDESNSNLMKLLSTRLESSIKRSGDCNQNKKELCIGKSISFERKISAFDIFCRSNRLEVAAQNPEFNNQQIAEVLSEKWNRLSAEEKVVYRNMLDREYKKVIKKKERLGKTISQNLSEKKEEVVSTSKSTKTKLKPKKNEKDLPYSMEYIKSFNLNKKRAKISNEDMSIINYLAPGIWVCAQKEKLYLLNTFRLQETIIYHRLLETFQFEPESLETPQPLHTNNLGEDAMTLLMQLCNSDNNTSGKISDERLTANGFAIRIVKGDHDEVSAELIGIVNCIAFYGLPDLKELLLKIKENGSSSKLSLCRPSKIVLYLQSEANRMSRQSPACQRLQDVEDLLNRRNHLPADCNVCIHHKTFFSEIWKLNSDA